VTVEVTGAVIDVAVEMAEPVLVVAEAAVAAELVLVPELVLVAAELAPEVTGAAVEAAAGRVEPLLLEPLLLVAVATAAGMLETADAAVAVADVMSEVSVAVPVAADAAGGEVTGGVAACACRENASKTARIAAARIAPCTARRATWRKTS
jgi:hypothetical protein